MKPNERAFLEDIESIGGVYNPLIRNTFLFEDQVAVTLDPWGSGVAFDIWTFGSQKQGHASRVLDRVLRLADKHEVTLTGTVEPFGERRGLNKSQLKSWYARHGFTIVRNGYMEYHPQKAKVTYKVSSKPVKLDLSKSRMISIKTTR